MNLTSQSLLERLRQADPSATDWQRLTDIYEPLVRAWLARTPGLANEIDDLAQEVLIVLLKELPRFDRQRDGSFRAWLRQVTVNHIRTWRRARQRLPVVGLDPVDGYLARLEDSTSDPAREWDREHDQFVFDRLLTAVRPDFEPKTWEAFRLTAIEGQSVAAVAAKTGLSDNAVMLAKSRILKRLRDEAAGLLDS